MGLFSLLKKKAVAADLIAWQNLLCKESYNDLLMTRQQLEDETCQQVKNCMRIFDESAKIINATTKPDVFFGRLKLAEEKLYYLDSIEPYMRRVSRIRLATPVSDLLNKFNQEKDGYIRSFIDRYYSDIEEKSRKMKTERGRLAKIQTFKDSFAPYLFLLSERNKEYVDFLYQRNI